MFEITTSTTGITGSYTLYTDYYLNKSLNSVTFYLEHKSGSSWVQENSTTGSYSSGWTTNKQLFTINFSTERKYRIRLKYTKSKTASRSFTCQIYVNNATVLSLSAAGGKGKFFGSFTGNGDFDSAKIGGNVINEYGVNTPDVSGDDILIDISETYWKSGTKGFLCSAGNNGQWAGLDAYGVHGSHYADSLSDDTANFSLHPSCITTHENSSNYCNYGICIADGKLNGNSYYLQWTGYSDRRLKDNILNIDKNLSQKLIDGTRPVRFNYKTDDSEIHYGMIAQEARELLDSLGENGSVIEFKPQSSDKEEYGAIHYQEYIPHLINYVKELRKELDEVKAELKALKGE